MFIKLVLLASLAAIVHGQVSMEDCHSNFDSCIAVAYSKAQETGEWTEVDKCQTEYDVCYRVVTQQRIKSEQYFW